MPAALPAAYVTLDGRVTKILVDASTLQRLPTTFRMAPAYFRQVCREYAGRRGPFYLTPPSGSVRADWRNYIPVLLPAPDAGGFDSTGASKPAVGGRAATRCRSSGNQVE
jgi:hypothetical protein